MSFDEFWLKDRRRADGSRPPLFGGAEDWELNAITDKGVSLHAMGFELAARLLVEAAESKKEPIDALVWPIVFCYRHSVELQLKEALRYTIGLGDVDRGNALEVLADHNLASLWQLVRKSILDNDSAGEWKKDLGLLDKRIEEFHLRDPRSTEFRYPWLIDGTVKRSGDDEYYINLRQLREAMAVLTQRLNALVDWFDRVWEHVCEMRREFGSG